jgi:hypothetical protein
MPQLTRLAWATGLALVVLALGWTPRPVRAETPAPDYTKDIQPILARSCYACHAAKSQMGGLRLDARKTALTGGVSGPSIVAGQSAASPLYQRVAGIGDQARMPMGGKPLPAAEIDLLKRWIDSGASWPDLGNENVQVSKHWAFVAPQRPALPAVSQAAWVRTPVDRFVLNKLDAEGLKPSPEADRITLLRRASLDLTGLPPTPEEVDAFVRDRAPNAFEKQVDRLLASPHYGERWARHWLDAARYADSDGFEKDKPRNVWFYRDWVINALNRDLPYRQFVIDQIAGDLVPNATQDQHVATGFLRNSMINEEGGIDPEQFRMEAMFDRMDAIGKSILGLTIGCAQCHNHKFDPLTQEEYYRLFAFVNQSDEGSIAVYTPAEQRKRAEIFRRTRQLEAELQHRTPDWAARMAAWENQAQAQQPEWKVFLPEVDDISTGGARYLPQADQSLLQAGYAPTKHRVKLIYQTKDTNIRAFRLELLNDANLPFRGPGRSPKGTAALTEFEGEAVPAGQPDAKPVKLKIARATADLNLPEAPLDAMFDDRSKRRRVTGPIDFAIDGKEDTAWGIDAGPHLRNQPRQAVFELAEPVGFPQGTILNIYLKQNHGGWNSDDNQNHNLGRFRLAYTQTAGAAADPVPAAVRALLGQSRTPAQTQAVFAYWRTTVPEWASVNEQIARLWREHPEGTSQLVMSEQNRPRMTHVLTRGDFLKPAKQVPPGTPGFLHSLPKANPNRLDFAHWLVDREAPTTARALVNRVWQCYFGTGIVATSEDLGKQSDPPSHRELLDWLAVEFMDPKTPGAKPWSLKSLHRQIVLSATYRQSSRVTPDLLKRDPYNRLLARGPRFRVEGEIVRDIALAASGLLNPQVGGPSVFPPSPEFLYLPPVSYGPKMWKEETGPNRYRRGLYTFSYRSVPYPALQNFDTPNGDISCVRRARSNTPLQALTTLNEPLFLEAAQALAERTIENGGSTDDARLRYAFRRVLSRAPENAEAQELLALLQKQRSRYTGDGAYLGERQAWTAVARVLFNLDEAITKE